MLPAILIIAIIAFFIISFYIEKSVFPKLYRETRKNPFTFFHKILCVAMGMFFIILLPFEDNDVWGYGILAEVVAIGLTVLLNLKYKEPKLIAKVTAIQVAFGIAFSVRFALWIVMLAFSMSDLVLGRGEWSGTKMKLFGSFDYNQIAAQRDEEIRAAQEAEKERNNEAAEAYAQSYGFESADQAEDYGLKTGKKD